MAVRRRFIAVATPWRSPKIAEPATVHHVHVDPIRPGLLRLDHLLAQTGEVSGEN